MRQITLWWILALFLSACGATVNPDYSNIPASDSKIFYTGRILKTVSTVVLSWPGTQVTVKFHGTLLSVTMEDQSGDNYYQVIIDNDSSYVLKPQKGKHTYILARNLKDRVHTVTMFKRTEYIFGKTEIYSFATEKRGRFLPAKSPHKMTIEFYGNSITAGLGNEHPQGSSFNPQYENNYMAYGAITARMLGAEYVCIARSGIGMTVSWDSLIMPELFWRLDPFNPYLHWDYSTRQPQIVVVNLFQNDSWLVQRPEHPQYKLRFGDKKPDDEFFISSYERFIDTLATIYPQAQIICTLGPMSAVHPGSPWPGYIKIAVARLHTRRIHTFFFPYFVRHGHPTIKDHEQMAQMLTQFIRDSVLISSQ